MRASEGREATAATRERRPQVGGEGPPAHKQRRVADAHRRDRQAMDGEENWGGMDADHLLAVTGS
jgi:hypothetical protein